MYKRLVCFDFDGTLFNTPNPIDGVRMWKEITGNDWPYGGWWGRAESIDPDIFYIPLNIWVYNKYLKEISDSDNYVILATGRIRRRENMEKNVIKILNQNNISFEEIHLNWGNNTFNFKTTLFEEKIKELNVEEFTMYDDRHDHIVKFKDWADEQSIKIKIVDVLNKTEYFNK